MKDKISLLKRTIDILLENKMCKFIWGKETEHRILVIDRY